MATSSEYWREREQENLKKNLKSEAESAKELNRIYGDAMDNIQKEIDAFYGRYAGKEGITIAEAKKRVSKLDIEAYSRKAEKYVREKDFSKQANEEMRLYNLTMKVNRLEMLKAQIGLELVSSFDEMQKFFEQKLTDRTLEEFERQAGILGESVGDVTLAASSIVGASFHNATFSQRIWANQDLLRSEISKLLQTGMIQGRHPDVLARELRKQIDVSRFNSERLMRTEMARVQTEAQMQSFDRYGFDEYEYLACHYGDVCAACKALDGRHFKTKDAMPGENAPPMHPFCHCSTCAWLDEEKYSQWLDSYGDHGMSFKEWRNARGENESSNKQYKYRETVVKKNTINSASYRSKFNNVSDDASINRTAYARAKEMLKHRSGTKYEDIAFIDTRTGKSLINKGYDVESTAKPSKAMKRMLNNSEPGTIIAIHNHPGSSVPSIPDLMVCMKRGYKFGLVACHDGNIYKYVVNKEKFNPTIAKLALDRMELKGYNDDVIKMFEDSGVTMEVL